MKKLSVQSKNSERRECIWRTTGAKLIQTFVFSCLPFRFYSKCHSTKYLVAIGSAVSNRASWRDVEPVRCKWVLPCSSLQCFQCSSQFKHICCSGVSQVHFEESLSSLCRKSFECLLVLSFPHYFHFWKNDTLYQCNSLYHCPPRECSRMATSSVQLGQHLWEPRGYKSRDHSIDSLDLSLSFASFPLLSLVDLFPLLSYRVIQTS